MTIPAICARADSLGLDTIAITDHVFAPEDLSIIDRIAKEASVLKSACRVIVGAEIDVDASFSDGRLITDRLENIDYVVASIHYIPHIGNYPFSPSDSIHKPEDLLKYWSSTLLGVVSNPRIDTLAHPGRMIGSSMDLDIFFEDILAVFTEAAKISADNNIAWEINELTGPRFPQYYLDLWPRIYHAALAAGVKLIYGSDAHTPQYIAADDFTRSILKKLPKNSLSSPQTIGI